jgi:hypothetical protein
MIGKDTIDTLTNKTINATSNTITNITNSNINDNAMIDSTKIANGNMTNTEFQYISGTTRPIQTQINNKITNSYGVPQISSLFLASRPAPGIPGSIFIGSDNLTMYRDNGTTWDTLNTTPTNPIIPDAQTVIETNPVTTTSTSYVDLSGISLTTSNTNAKKYIVMFNCNVSLSKNNNTVYVIINIDGVDIISSESLITITGSDKTNNISSIYLTPWLATNKIIKVRFKCSDGTLTVTNRTLIIYG